MEEEEVTVAVEEDKEASVLEAAVYHVMLATNSLSDNEDSLVEHGGIASPSEDLPSTSDNLKPTVAPYTPVSTTSPVVCASASNAPQDAVPVPFLPVMPVLAAMIGPSQHQTSGRFCGV